MNPGYAGRTELPDNLKSMFRPISMMVPDSGIIAENILFSDGFQNTKQLAKKVFTLYRLAVQQLSKQDHYDFGLRSMVALLRYAGKKRRLMPNTREEEVVYLAMRDMNIARFTANDLPLFNGIMSDIFPGTRIPDVDYMDINFALTDFMTENNLQVNIFLVANSNHFFRLKTLDRQHLLRNLMVLGVAYLQYLSNNLSKEYTTNIIYIPLFLISSNRNYCATSNCINLMYILKNTAYSSVLS